MNKEQINLGIGNYLTYKQKGRSLADEHLNKKDLFTREYNVKKEAVNSNIKNIDAWTKNSIFNKKANSKLSYVYASFNNYLEKNKNFSENVKKNFPQKITNNINIDYDKRINEIKDENEAYINNEKNTKKIRPIKVFLFIILWAILYYFINIFSWQTYIFKYIYNSIYSTDYAIVCACVYNILQFLFYTIGITIIVNTFITHKKIEIKTNGGLIAFLTIINTYAIIFLTLFDNSSSIIDIKVFLYFVLLITYPIFIIKLKEQTRKFEDCYNYKASHKIVPKILIVVTDITAIFFGLGYFIEHEGGLIIQFLISFLLVVTCLIFSKKNDRYIKFSNFLDTQIKKYNHIIYEISKDIYVEIKQINDELENEWKTKLNMLEEEYNKNFGEIYDNYDRSIKLPDEIIKMYENLQKEEQDLFVMLARNAESEKEFSNIYVQCINAENSRKVYEEQRKQTETLQKQTRIVEEEHKKQTRILKERAEQERIHMENVERQNKELLRKQDEANKLAEKNAKKELELARKSVSSLEKLEEQARLANDKSSDYYRGNR